MESEGQELFIARLATGLLQGLALYLLYSALDDKTWPATQGPVFSPLLLTFLFIPPLLIQALGEMPGNKALLWAAVAALAIASLGFFDNWNVWPGEGFTLNHWQSHALPSVRVIFFGGIGLFIAHALVVGGASDRRFKATYPTHFDTAWKLAVQLALAGLFVGIFWLLLFLGAGLFHLIKLSFFETLIENSWFAIPATALAAAGALHLTDVRPALVRSARTLLLTLLSWLLPLIAMIVAGFVVSLPFTGLGALWNIGSASMVLLTATSAVILLINAAHQDGEADRLPPKVLRLAGTLAAILPAPLSLIAVYALYLRVSQYGWSTDRVMLAANVTIAVSYAAGYAFAALRPGPWLGTIKTWNFYVSILILAIIVALFTPIADPTRIAVADQMARLNSGAISPAKFDFHYLRWDTGRYGRNALAALAASQNSVIRRKAQVALRQLDKYPVAPSEPLVNRLTVYPHGQKLPQSFIRTDWNRLGISAEPNCPAGQFCDAILIDLNGDKQPEILIVWNFSVEVFEMAGDKWQRAGTIFLPRQCSAVTKALQEGHFSFSAPIPRWNDIRIGTARLHVQDYRQATSECPA